MSNMSDLDDIEKLQEKLLDMEEDEEQPDIIYDVGSKQSIRNKTPKTQGLSKCAGSFGCCLAKTCCILMVVLLVISVAVFAMAYRWTSDVVQHLTVQDSQTFPIVEMSDAQIDYLESRVKIFVDELRMNKVPQDDLVITQDDINGLLGHCDYLRGNMYVTLTEGKILEEYSLPVDMLPGGKGRFFLGHDYTAIDVKAHRVELKMETAAKHEDWFVGPLYFLQLHFEGRDFAEYNHQHLLELVMENGTYSRTRIFKCISLR